MRWFVGAILVLVLAGGLWWMEQQRQAELTPKADPGIPVEPERAEPRHPLPKPEIHPVPAPAAEHSPEDVDDGALSERAEVQPDPLPELPESDEAALDALSSLLGGPVVARWVKPEFVIARTVAIVNSLDRQAPALKTRPLRTLDSQPRTRSVESEETSLWVEANAGRYAELVIALESAPPEEVAARYARFYPLFQRAWDELGETEPYFNDRLIDIIDHLLATPEVDLPFEVVPYESKLQFADEALQEESWGRKLLIRMGPEHADRVQEWLQRLRNAVIGAPEPSPGR